LYETNQCLAIRRNSQAFHAFVGGATTGVAADFGRANRIQIADKQVRGQFKDTGTPSA